jgi:carbonic anhydrase
MHHFRDVEQFCTQAARRCLISPHRPAIHLRTPGVFVSVTDELLANNARYTETFRGPLPLPPAKRVAVVACMDARLDVYRILGLNEGEAHVIRNAGGVVTDDEIRSLAISQRLLGTQEIILIHHTDCGMLTFTDDQFTRSIQDDTGIKPAWAAEAFPDLDEDIRQSIARIKASPFVPNKDSIRGFVFDVATGKLNEVQGLRHSRAVVVTSFLDRLVRRLGA